MGLTNVCLYIFANPVHYKISGILREKNKSAMSMLDIQYRNKSYEHHGAAGMV